MQNTPQWLIKTPIAHRGLHSKTLPENSIGAFLEAKKQGFAIEIDIHLTSDGHIVVFHDEDLFRMTGTKGDIRQKPLEEVKKLRLQNTGYSIPVLKEVLYLVGSEVPLLIEIKSVGKDAVGKLEDALIKELDNYKGEFAIQSFNPYSLEYIKNNRANFLRGQISQFFKQKKMTFFKRYALKNMLLNKKSEPHFIVYKIQDLPFKKVEKLKAKGIPILAYTIAGRADLKKAKELADNIIFDHIAKLLV